MVLNHGSLFSGIGGFDLAAECMGWNNIFHCEWNPFGQKILKYYWPNAISYGDIKQTDFTIHRGNIDILTGGFPCQPYSVAGKRLGKEDERHLWPEMLRAIREIHPTYIVGENVPGLLTWNGGLVFDEVQADLENEGYEIWPVILPACGKNAPHKRERVWFVAYSGDERCNNGSNNREERHLQTDCRTSTENKPERNGWERRISEVSETITNTERFGQSGQGRTKGQCSEKTYRNWEASWTNANGGWPTQPWVRSGNDGISDRLDGITVSEWSKESLKAYGNAIVPQVALEIFKAISKAGSARQKKQ
ncbi:DNA cytosine methyltransferase [Sunxiuqinia indica]|uniref:DNA cytosine methyltransferase n=1 Tax=Sunxiuqinia indica TaxID=2692584 RepID=UPI00135CEB42|nr:DNA (cytosine-5-)-methyltransferase [Sunxiuqinia indica]